MAIQFKSKQLQNYKFIRSKMKTLYGQFYGLCDILFTNRIGFAWDFPTFAADNNGTDVLLWQDQQA